MEKERKKRKDKRYDDLTVVATDYGGYTDSGSSSDCGSSVDCSGADCSC